MMSRKQGIPAADDLWMIDDLLRYRRLNAAAGRNPKNGFSAAVGLYQACIWLAH
jgi:hypothetical protein